MRFLRMFAVVGGVGVLGGLCVVTPPAQVDLYTYVAHLTTREKFEKFSPVHQRMLAHAARESAERRGPRETSLCWEEGADTDLPALFQMALMGNLFAHFNLGSGWPGTGTDVGPIPQGGPMTLLWSIVPDGLSIPGFNGEPTSNSNLIAFLDGIYGAGPGGPNLTLRPWFPTFTQIFTVWSQFIGVQYVFTTDDGAVMGAAGSVGIPGVRGDLRICGHFIDGQVGSNVLAYNFFPGNALPGRDGDMVIDTSNVTFFGDTSSSSIRLRNVLSHEHGHGLGIQHVCSSDRDFLMEPFINLAFDGPQEDDVLGANRQNGDRFEFAVGNESAASATSLGAIPHGGNATRTTLSVDGTADQDWYAFTVPAASKCSVTVTPTGTTYFDGDQIQGFCPEGGEPVFNALTQRDLSLEIRGGPAGATVLASQNAAGLGGAETASNVPLTLGAGTYFARVQGVGGSDVAQMYDLAVAVAAAPLPVLTCPPDTTVECGVATTLTFGVGHPEGLAVTVEFQLDGVPVTTLVLPAGPAPTSGTFVVPFTFTAGVHTVLATATDARGGLATCTTTVTGADTVPPTLTITLGRSALWFPLYGMADVGLTVTATDGCDPDPQILVTVYSDEPAGFLTPDAQIVGVPPNQHLLLRVEREPVFNNGRYYLVVVDAVDASGNRRRDSVTVVVPYNWTTAAILAWRALTPPLLPGIPTPFVGPGDSVGPAAPQGTSTLLSLAPFN